MEFRIWTYDLAREQHADLDFLRKLCRISIEAGYTGLGLYLEHRFAYPSLPFAHGEGCLTPEMVEILQTEFPELELIPFINLLGHFEGMLYTEEGHDMSAERFKGLQADALHPAFLETCEKILADTLRIFKSKWIHIGGDETAQLGLGKYSEPWMTAQLKAEPDQDAKAVLYGQHFAKLAHRVSEAGRVPCVWGDMFFEHPTALELIPKETVIFDWQYFKSPELTSKLFRDAGFATVFCPAIHTYNAIWCHLPQSERNVAEHAEAAERLGALGVCVTTWECALMGNYETILPAIIASGKILTAAAPGKDQGAPLDAASRDEDIAEYAKTTDAPRFLAEYLKQSESAEEWARLLGVELQKVGGLYGFTGIRSALKCRLLLYSNPFLAWLHHAKEITDADAKTGDLSLSMGDRVLQLVERSLIFSTTPHQRGLYTWCRKSVEFIVLAERAHLAYAARKPGEAIAALSPCRQIFEDLERVAQATHLNAGGSLADVYRCRAARRHIEEVILRVKQYGDGSLGYLPSFETLTHPKFIPHDQANWWLINRWANE